jgi:hypothetical protein
MGDDKKLCQLLREVIRDEEYATDKYAEIVREVYGEYIPVEDTLIREGLILISKQEGTHRDLLKAMYATKCPVK